MAADLPKEFDVVVLGTGMPESILAAAFSRIGHSVLHLDRNDHYSDDWASFNLDGIQRWVDKHTNTEQKVDENELKRPDVDEFSFLEQGETLTQLPLEHTSYSNVRMQFHVGEAEEAVEEKLISGSIAQITVDNSDEAVPEQPSNTNVCDQSTNSTSVAEAGEQEAVDIKPNSPSAQQEVDNTDQTTVTAESQLIPDTQTEKQTADLKQTDEKSIDSDVTSTQSSANKDTDDEVQSECQSVITEVQSECQSVIKDGESCEGQGEATVNAEVQEKDNTDNSHGPIIETEPVKAKVWDATKLKNDWRRFNLDLSPKILYSGGRLVELLISSDIAKYCEFKTVTRVLTILNGNIEQVPCSRADVFSSKKVSMLEKRMLMKFLTFCMEHEQKPAEIQDFLDKPFAKFLDSRKLTPNVKHFVQHSIAMATDSMSTKQGLSQTRKFLQSLGRYGNTAFLWSLYGSGELPQSFCRMCAVFGGLYCLRMSVSSVITDSENKCNAVITTEGQRIACKWLIMNQSYAAKVFLPNTPVRYISRAILIADKPLLPTESQELSLMCVPSPDDGDRPINVLELAPGSMACPTGLYVFHLTRQANGDVSPEQDLAYVVDLLFQAEEGDSPHILWSVYFTQTDTSQMTVGENCPSNIILLSGPGTEVDIDKPVFEAEEIFSRILPDEEFLPKAPNPEDIIYVDDAEAQVNEGSSQSEFVETNVPAASQSESTEPVEPMGQESVVTETSEPVAESDKHTRAEPVLESGVNPVPESENKDSSPNTDG